MTLQAVPPSPIASSNENIQIYQLIRTITKHGASDLHLKENRPPLYRINGKVMAAKTDPLSAEKIKSILFELMSPRVRQILEQKLQVDFSFNVAELGRYRANVYLQRGTIAAAIRKIPSEVREFNSIGLPTGLKEIILQRGGLVLVTGATGSGKSTTLASMLDYINRHRHAHIITIEDPIEFIHKDIKCTLSQREIGTDALTIQDALKGALRQDPDVILIGEMRDYETIGAALTAAETGHLVLSTLHTNDAASSIKRILDVFPPEAKDQARVQLSSSLSAVLCQKLINKKDGSGRVVVTEYMVNSPSIETLIRDNELEKIEEIIKSSSTYYGMHTFNQALENMVSENKITNEEAIKASNAQDDLKMRLMGFKREEGY